MRLIAMAVLILFNFVLQSTVLTRLNVFGVQPDTAIIFIVGYGIMRGDVEGAIFGFFAGLAHDIFGNNFIGMYAMLGMLIGYFAGKPLKDFLHTNHIMPFFMIIVGTFAYQFALFLLYAFIFLTMDRAHPIDLWRHFGSIILPTTVYTALFAMPLYRFLFWVNKKIEYYEGGRSRFFDNT